MLADIPKTMVYELAEYINRRQGKEIIPRRTITKPPSAELRPDQKDEDSLPPYRELDPILELYLEKIWRRKKSSPAGTTKKPFTGSSNS